MRDDGLWMMDVIGGAACLLLLKFVVFHQYFKLSVGEHIRRLSRTFARIAANICANGRQQTYKMKLITGKMG